MLRDEELRAAIDTEDVVEFGFGDGFLVNEGLDARVRDDDVEPAEVRDRLVEELRHGGGFADVGFDGDGARGVLFLEGLDEGVGGTAGFAVVD